MFHKAIATFVFLLAMISSSYSNPKTVMDDDLNIKVSVDSNDLEMHITIENTSNDKPFEFHMASIPFVTVMAIINNSKGERISNKLPKLPSHNNVTYSIIKIAPKTSWKFDIPFSQLLTPSGIATLDTKESVRWYLAIVASINPLRTIHINGDSLYLDKTKIIEEIKKASSKKEISN